MKVLINICRWELLLSLLIFILKSKRARKQISRSRLSIIFKYFLLILLKETSYATFIVSNAKYFVFSFQFAIWVLFFPFSFRPVSKKNYFNNSCESVKFHRFWNSKAAHPEAIFIIFMSNEETTKVKRTSWNNFRAERDEVKWKTREGGK